MKNFMNQKNKTKKGFIQIPIVIAIIVSVIVVSGIGYGVIEYTKTSKLIKEAEKLSKEEKYGEAINKLEFAQKRLVGKILNKKINTELEKNKKLLEDQTEYTQGIEEFNKGNWERAKELLLKVSENFPHYQDAKNKIEETEKKILEEKAAEKIKEIEERAQKENEEEKGKITKNQLQSEGQLNQQQIPELQQKEVEEEKILEGTEVQGIISSDTTWSLKNSPYIVTGNILVDENATLTIEPGVEVKVKESPLGLQKQYYIEVRGTLIARGTKDKKIIFTSLSKEKLQGKETRSELNWEGIQFVNCKDWDENNNTGSVIENSIIEYASFDKPAIGINGCSPLIKNNVIRFIGWEAISIEGENTRGVRVENENYKKTAPKIINNQIQSGRITIGGESSPYFFNNTITGNGFYIVGGSPIITKNNITGNRGDTYGGGIRIDGGSPIITYNNITNNTPNGISIVGCRNCNPIIEHNNIYGNKPFSVLLTDTKDTFNFPNNWWGTTKTLTIDSLIYDYHDDFNLGKVNYQPIATSEIPNEEVVSKETEEISNTKYATVVKLTDSKGNVEFHSEYNGKKPTWPNPWPELKVGETITIKVEVNDTNAGPVFYEFVGPGFPNTWQTENWVTVTIDNEIFNLETIHLRVFVKNSDNQYRAPDYDDMIQVFYKIKR